MEKKIERVPYISKWYKEELDWSQLFKFDFKDEPMTEKTAKELNNCFKETMDYLNNAGSDYDIDKTVIDWKNKTTTTISCPNGIHFWSPQKPQLKFEHYLTQKDVDYLLELIRLTRIDIESIKHVPSKESDARYRLGVIENYIRNAFGIRDKAQEKQLKELIEQSKPKKSYEGTLGEHWKELMDLFELKNNEGLGSLDDFVKSYEICKKRNIEFRVLCIPDDDSKISINKQKDDANKLYYIYETLGIDFIKDFIKACEKCED